MRRLVLALCLLLAAPAFAVQPDEVLDDPVLEARARAIGAELRCPVCQNESIDESNAAISRELRILVRERLTAGDTDAQIIDYIVARYGEFVLLNPPAAGINLVLWIAGPAMLVAAGAIGWATIRRRATAPGPEALTEAERARLDEILKS
jgi:cytochrome c-type biogenesis protein CcmH